VHDSTPTPKQYRPRIAGIVAALFLAALPPGAVANDDDEFVAVRAGRILTVSGEETKDGVIVIRNGKIEAVGESVEIPFGAKVIDARDLVVMPGMVNVATRFGLASYQRRGSRAHLVAADEIYPREKLFRELLEAGFTTVALFPAGSDLPGQASAVHPLPRDREEIVLDREAYIRVPFTRPSRDKKAVRTALKQAQAEIEKIEKARKAFEEKQKKKAEEEAKKKKAEEEKKKEKEPPEKEPPETPPEDEGAREEGEEKKEQEKKKEPEEFQPPKIRDDLVPIVALLRKEGVRMLVEISRAEGFVHFEDLNEKFEVERSYLLRNPDQTMIGDFFSVSDTDAGLVAEAMGKTKARLALYPVINHLPYTLDRVSLPLEFLRAGCEVSFFPAGDDERGFRHFREMVAVVVRDGFPRDKALEALTLRPARMLGLEDRLGTLEPGKDADLIFLDGDPLDAFTRVRKVMIGGEIVAEPEPTP